MSDYIGVIVFVATIAGFLIRFYYSVNQLQNEVKLLKESNDICLKLRSRVDLIEYELHSVKEFETKANQKFESIANELKTMSNLLTRIDTKLEEIRGRNV